MSPEASKNFQAKQFVGKRREAIWMDDEFNPPMYDAFLKPHLNKLLEGSMDSYIPMKNQKPAHCTYRGFTILMTNHTIEELLSIEPSQGQKEVHQIEFERRMTAYKLKPDPSLKRHQQIPTYQITHPVALRQGLRMVATDHKSNIQAIMNPEMYDATQFDSEGIYHCLEIQR